MAKRSSAQQDLLDSGSLQCSGGQGVQEQHTLSSCSGSTVSLNVRLDPSETQSARVQLGQSESGRELPRWGAKRRATSRCLSTKLSPPQAASPAPAQLASQPSATASRGTVGALEKPDWAPATPLRQQSAAAGPEQQGPASVCSQPLTKVQEPAACQAARSTDLPAVEGPPSPASQQALPTFSADPSFRRAAFKAWRCSDAETRLAGAFTQPGVASAGASALTQPLLAGLYAWSAQDAFLRPAASSALQLAPPSLPQMLSGPQHHMTALKPFWSQHQQPLPAHQWPAALPSNGAQPAAANAAAAPLPCPASYAQDQGHFPLSSRPSGPQHMQHLSPSPSAASPWGRSAAPCHPAQLAGLTQAGAHASGLSQTPDMASCCQQKCRVHSACIAAAAVAIAAATKPLGSCLHHQGVHRSHRLGMRMLILSLVPFQQLAVLCRHKSLLLCQGFPFCNLGILLIKSFIVHLATVHRNYKTAVVARPAAFEQSQHFESYVHGAQTAALHYPVSWK